ncbi:MULTISPECIES: hypothetical protein [unclassified Streptomyces]|uniref:hypothetical protein n=1 Tax=unclassified Streptomyces TaxID=2593676 RepID=UPI003826D4A1
MMPALCAVLYSKLWHDHRVLAYIVVAGVCLVPTYAVYFAARPLIARYGLRVWQCALVGVLLATVAWEGPKAAAYVWPSVSDRYERELGGAGQCLYYSPYRLDRAVTMFERDKALMVVEPLAKGAPALRLINARTGGMRALAPADRQSKEILAAYGC